LSRAFVASKATEIETQLLEALVPSMLDWDRPCNTKSLSMFCRYLDGRRSNASPNGGVFDGTEFAVRRYGLVVSSQNLKSQMMYEFQENIDPLT